MTDALTIEDLGRVRRLTLSAPRRRNALSFALCAQLVGALRAAEADAAVGAVILTGNGPAFSAGGDQNDFRKATAEAPPKVLKNYPALDLFRIARNFHKPLIAAVNGAALGGGMGLVCLSHLALAVPEASFGIPEVRLGLFPATVLPVVRPLLGERLTYDLALTGRTMSAQEALEARIINRIVAPERLQDEALELASRIASFSPLAVGLGLESLQVSADMPFEDAIQYLNAIRTVYFASEDIREGGAAFLEKRPPVWRGR